MGRQVGGGARGREVVAESCGSDSLAVWREREREREREAGREREREVERERKRREREEERERERERERDARPPRERELWGPSRL